MINYLYKLLTGVDVDSLKDEISRLKKKILYLNADIAGKKTMSL